MTVANIAARLPGQTPNVNTPSLDYETMEKARKLPRALVGGTDTMREGKALWTPKLKEESDAELADRLKHHFLVDFYDQSVSDLVDRMYSQGITFEGVPPQVDELLANIDGQGRSVEKFFYDVTLDAGRYAYSTVHADHTPIKRDDKGNEIQMTEAEEAEAGRRPFLVHRKSADVISVDQTGGDGLPEVDQARIREMKIEKDGDYGQKASKFVRVLKRGEGGAPSTFELHKHDEERDIWEPQGVVTNTPPNSAGAVASKFSQVFLTPFYMGFERFHFARPQYRNGADLCLQHWQQKGDVDFIEHLANTPNLVLKADGKVKIKSIGSRKLVTIPSEGDLFWLVIDPKGVGATKESIAHLEEHILDAFKQPRRQKANAAELVGVRLMDEGKTMTRAQMWAVGIAQSITQCLDHLAWWLGLESGGTAEFPKDALQMLTDPQGFADVLKMHAQGALSDFGTQEEAVRYGRLDEDFDIAADLERKATQSPGLPTFEGGGE